MCVLRFFLKMFVYIIIKLNGFIKYFLWINNNEN